MSIRLVGDWDRAFKIMGGLSERHRRASKQAILKEANFLRAQLIKGISSGAPGGKPYAPLSQLTMAVRALKGFGGSKPLIVTGALRGSISVVEVGGVGAGGAVFVGIRRGARTANGGDMVNLAEIHEYGRTWTRALTDKQRRLIFAAMGKAGISPRNAKVQGAGGATVFKIPARPTFGPVFEMYAKPEDVKKRFWENYSKAMGFELGRP